MVLPYLYRGKCAYAVDF